MGERTGSRAFQWVWSYVLMRPRKLLHKASPVRVAASLRKAQMKNMQLVDGILVLAPSLKTCFTNNGLRTLLVHLIPSYPCTLRVAPADTTGTPI
jgi:hypothetical protein